MSAPPRVGASSVPQEDDGLKVPATMMGAIKISANGGNGPSAGVANAPPDILGTLDEYERNAIQSIYDRFDAYWQGPHAHQKWKEEDKLGKRKAIYSKIRLPRKQRAQMHVGCQPDGPVLVPRKHRYRLLQPVTTQRYRNYASDIEKGEYGLVKALNPLGFRFLRVLGKGGYGCACLFQMDDVDGVSHKVVVKAALQEDLVKPEMLNLRVRKHLHSSNSSLRKVS